ncbi:transposase, partial [Luteolibacter pohnpeiensis]|nr:transposase [Luteolibacter pohnpeiensis]
MYFVTREKSNSAMKTLSIERHNRKDPRYEGILSDTLVGNPNGEALRRIIYYDPSDEKIYNYLTNEMQLPAWAIALGYKHRWDIEKVFDQFKNKMAETKSWASSHTAKEAQA